MNTSGRFRKAWESAYPPPSSIMEWDGGALDIRDIGRDDPALGACPADAHIVQQNALVVNSKVLSTPR